MLCFLSWLITLYAPMFVTSVSVNIDGVIDLGPKWNYEYKIKSSETFPTTEPTEPFTVAPDFFRGISKKKEKKRKKNATPAADINPDSLITKYSHRFKPKSIYDRPHSVKDDSKINEFTYHVYKQSMKVFDEIKKKVDPSIQHKVQFLARSYDDKFREFVNETLHQKIKTRLGSERVVLNIIDTSNRLLKRLVNYFIGDMNKEGIQRNNMAAANVLQKEVERESVLELKHACSKFSICRNSNGFSEFMIDVFTIIAKNDDAKIKQAADALTEVMKNTDFSKVMDWNTRKKFMKKIEEIESLDPLMLKAMFWIAINAFSMKNKPLNVMDDDSGQINKTIAFLEIIHELDKKLPANDENMLEWNDIKTKSEVQSLSTAGLL
ncbi:uncharacterized protein LOC114351601 [Ostrinia furnacalis]|uniref:uncharacterized protein LOC114351601 n=1 Tax=Ostrinia furnacalis TaxID=93504 RepID=UPI00103B0AC7|nr:uncharacterized protein LOC114351601 [Ostrinia furnacalis]